MQKTYLNPLLFFVDKVHFDAVDKKCISIYNERESGYFKTIIKAFYAGLSSGKDVNIREIYDVAVAHLHLYPGFSDTNSFGLDEKNFEKDGLIESMDNLKKLGILAFRIYNSLEDKKKMIDSFTICFKNGLFRLNEENSPIMNPMDAINTLAKEKYKAFQIHLQAKDREKLLNEQISLLKKELEHAKTEEDVIWVIVKSCRNISQIHPFRDGNARTTWTFLNNELIKRGFVLSWTNCMSFMDFNSMAKMRKIIKEGQKDFEKGFGDFLEWQKSLFAEIGQNELFGKTIEEREKFRNEIFIKPTYISSAMFSLIDEQDKRLLNIKKEDNKIEIFGSKAIFNKYFKKLSINNLDKIKASGLKTFYLSQDPSYLVVPTSVCKAIDACSQQAIQEEVKKIDNPSNYNIFPQDITKVEPTKNK